MKSKLLIGAVVLAVGIAIVGVREYTGIEKVSGGKVKNETVVEVPRVSTAPETRKYDKEVGEWASAMITLLSEPMDDPKLGEANNDEGFEYYLKAQEVIWAFPTHLIVEDKEIEKEHSNLFLLSSYIGHNQFVRTAHLDPNGQAKEDTSLSDQWKPTDDDMRQAFEYMKQIVYDIDVEVNHGGEGETFGVTHLLNGDKTSKMEDFVTGKSSRIGRND
ncbi:hypothetical protein [Sporosarcina sp. FSL K6-1508]|uniref:hypothetical protein n=1 Tax=Sporosarcina sp. FSL K6-1508 TaxID=2921553 RepID=UPI0030F94273